MATSQRPVNAGVYLYGADAFPTQVYQASNYWVDVSFSTAQWRDRRSGWRLCFRHLPQDGGSGSMPLGAGAPTILAAAVVGGALSATAGSWTNNPTSFTYQWQRCTGSCANITGATSTHVHGAIHGRWRHARRDRHRLEMQGVRRLRPARKPQQPGQLLCPRAAISPRPCRISPSQVNAASPGQTVCLMESGDYGSFATASISPRRESSLRQALALP